MFMVFAVVLLLFFATFLSKMRSNRVLEQRQKWKDIKDLEEDYEIYVSDEYAHHINDAKREQIATIYYAGGYSNTGVNQRTGSLEKQKFPKPSFITKKPPMSRLTSELVSKNHHSRLLSLRNEDERQRLSVNDAAGMDFSFKND